MKVVDILFQNLQSHENTRFTLMPGMNFILASDNNVGKSTIFKVISRMAQAPNISSDKIVSLVRNGHRKGCAAFRYDSESVVAYFIVNDSGTGDLFFEHTHSDGEVTRTVFCPKSLLDALSIVINEQGSIINFNDADSVQLISDNTVEADAIITKVMLDVNVERVKSNLYTLGKEVNSDKKIFSAQLKTAEHMLEDLNYQPNVNEFFMHLPVLEAASRVCDRGVIPLTKHSKEIPTEEEMLRASTLLSCVKSLEYFASVTSKYCSDVDLDKARAAMLSINGLGNLNFEVLNSTSTNPEELDTIKNYLTVCNSVKNAMLNAELMLSLSNENKRMTKECSQLLQSIQAQSETIECPVKGKVFYTDEKCLPYRTRPTL